MPTSKIQKILLITCIAVAAAMPVNIGHAEKTRILDHTVRTETQQAAPQMCGGTRATVTRPPVYRRYLKRAPALPFTPRRHG